MAAVQLTALRTRAWIMVVLATVLLTVDYMDRGALSVGAPLIRHQFGIGPALFGAILAIFAWPYAVSLLIAGVAVDRWGSRVLLGLGGVLWSLAQLGNAFATQTFQFFGLRVLLGIGESPAYMSAARATKHWFVEHEQNAPTGMWNSTSSLGPALAPLLLTPIMLAWGWRAMFVALGAVGIVLSLAWIAYHRDRPPVATAVVAAAPEAARPHLSLREWFGVFRHRSAAFLCVGAFFGGYWSFALISWLPSYLEVSRKVTIAETGVLASVPFLASFAGSLLGGLLPNLVVRVLGVDRVASCKVGLVGGAFVNALLIVPAVLTGNVAVSVVCLTLGGLFGGISSTSSWTTIEAVAPAPIVGAVGGIWDFGGFLGSGFGPLVTGLLLAATGTFLVPLMLGAVLLLAGSASYLFGIGGAVPDPRAAVVEAR